MVPLCVNDHPRLPIYHAPGTCLDSMNTRYHPSHDVSHPPPHPSRLAYSPLSLSPSPFVMCWTAPPASGLFLIFLDATLLSYLFAARVSLFLSPSRLSKPCSRPSYILNSLFAHTSPTLDGAHTCIVSRCSHYLDLFACPVIPRAATVHPNVALILFGTFVIIIHLTSAHMILR
jgi:hypothetical protein